MKNAATSKNGRARRLAQMRPGQDGTIVDLDRCEPVRLRKMLSLGLVPGARVRVERHQPAVVFWLGRTQFAIDAAMAESIHVRPLD